MKKSELKEYIREMVLNELKEAVAVRITSKTGDEIIQSFPSLSAADKLKQQNSNISKVKQFEAKYTDDEDVEIEDDWNKPSKDDDGEDEEKIDKKAQAAAKKGGSNITKLTRLTSQLKELEKEMKELVNKWKKSEGSEKEKLTNTLKEKTKTKKELEKMQDQLANSIK